MSFFYFLKKKERPIDNNISKQIIISVTNGELDEISKEDEQIIYRALYKKKRQILIDLDHAINLYSIKHIINKKDKFAEIEYCCKICMDNPIEVASQPCGHLFCKSCFEKSNGHCFTCRTPISKILNIYS